MDCWGSSNEAYNYCKWLLRFLANAAFRDFGTLDAPLDAILAHLSLMLIPNGHQNGAQNGSSTALPGGEPRPCLAGGGRPQK